MMSTRPTFPSKQLHPANSEELPSPFGGDNETNVLENPEAAAVLSSVTDTTVSGSVSLQAALWRWASVFILFPA